MKKMRIGRSFVLVGALVSALGSTGYAASVERSSGAAATTLAETALGALSPDEATATMNIPGMPPTAAALQERVTRPEDLDTVTKELNVPARLINFHMATLTDLSELGLGQAIYLPVAISEREGGRKSLYYLEPGEEVLAGLFVTNTGMALRYVKRETGQEVPARTGDVYTERYTSREGKELFAAQGKLEVIDPRIGKGRVTLTHTPAGEPLRTIKVSVWYYWSFIKVDVETSK